MSKIHYTKKSKRSTKGILSKALIAAALLSVLTVTAAAAESVFGAGDWFRGILNQRLKEEQQMVEELDLDVTVQETIGQNQIDILNEMGQVFEERAYTDQGTTVTMKAAYADANVMHMYIQVEAPEGTVLPDGVLYKFYDRDTLGDRSPLELATDAPYSLSGFQYEVESLPDDDPTDNMKDFHMTLYTQSGQEMALNDGVQKWWYSNGLYQQVVDADGDMDAFVLLAPGEFTFDISLVNNVRVVNLDLDGTSYGGHKVRTFTHPEGIDHTADCPPYDENGVHTQEWDYTVIPTKLQISPLSVDWACEFTCSEQHIFPSLSYKIVMKDGTIPIGRDHGGMDSDTAACGTIIYDTPIDLDQIDYILIGDEELGQTYKLTIPE